MANPLHITAEDLFLWSRTEPSKRYLPHLFRRLVYATVPSEHIKFVEFLEVNNSGYDGTTVVTKGDEFIPEGKTFWELGNEVGKEKSKADDDYTKNVDAWRKDGEKENLREVTYIQGTTLKWAKAGKWVETRDAEKIYRGVRAYNAERVSHWLEQAPTVAWWLREVISGASLSRSQATTLDEHWRILEGVIVAGPYLQKLPPKLLLVNRDRIQAEFTKWLSQPAEKLTVQAPASRELIDVFAAWVQTLPPSERDSVLSRTLVVNNEDVWMRLAAFERPLILVAGRDLNCTQDLCVVAARHHVLRWAANRKQRVAAVELGVMRRSDVRTELIAAGLPDGEAGRIAMQCGGSFTVLRRRLSPDIDVPPWGKEAALAPLLLGASWVNANEHDWRAMERLCLEEKSRAALDVFLREIQAGLESPVRLADGCWEFLSLADSWQFLAEFLTHPQHMDAFEAVAVEVLGEDNPALDLDPAERYLAAVKGAERKYSGKLREGLCEILAQAATLEEEGAGRPELCLAARARSIVRQILPPGCGWKRWASLGSNLAMLVEAAPDAVLEAIDADLARDNSSLVELMRQEIDPSAFSAAVYHTGVLWTLEKAGWSEEHFPRVAEALAQLAEKDPQGKSGNRPHGSLQSLFFSWRPQTLTPFVARLDILRRLSRTYPEVVWRVVAGLLPNTHSSIMDHSRPTYRDWAAGWDGGVSRKEYWDYVGGLVDIGVELAAETPTRWGQLVGELNRGWVEEDVEKVISSMERHVPDVAPQGRPLLWEKIDQVVRRHRSFHDADWALPANYVDRLEAVARRIVPEDPVLLAKRVFDDARAFEDDRTLPYEEREALRQERKRNAVREVWNVGGLGEVLRLAREVRAPWAVGLSLADALKSIPDSQIIPALLESETKEEAQLAATFASKRIWDEGAQWAENLPDETWTVVQIGIFASQMPFVARTWDWVAGKGEVAEDAYWKKASPGSRDLSFDEARRCVAELHRAGRPWAALDVVASRIYDRADLDVELACCALEGVLKLPVENQGNTMDSHHVHEVFGFLQERDDIDVNRVAGLEFEFLPMLTEFTRLPRVLQRELAKNPSLLIDCLKILYRPHNSPAEENTEEESDESRAKGERAGRIWQLLHDWRTVPGADDQGNIDAGVLSGWVAEVRRLAKEVDRLEVCDITIGQVLAYSGADPSDGAVPHMAVRLLLEEVRSAEIERGLRTGLHNRRGVTTRGMYEGGKQERDLAEDFRGYAKKCAAWPRVARVMKGLADDYEHEAKCHDESARAER